MLDAEVLSRTHPGMRLGYQPHIAMGGGEAFGNGARIIGRAVVDEDDLYLPGASEQALDAPRQERTRVVHRDNHRQHGQIAFSISPDGASEQLSGPAPLRSTDHSCRLEHHVAARRWRISLRRSSHRSCSGA